MTGVRAGDNDQVIALAEALGLPFDVKQLDFNALCHLGPRLLGASSISLTAASRAQIFASEPPDLTISAGHRSVPLVQALRRRSGGRLRSIHVGFPRISPANFDLVVTTPQYPIPDHPNLLRIPYALTRAATAAPDPRDEAMLEPLPKPRRLLIVGGPTLFWRLDNAELLKTLDRMFAEAAKEGGSVLVTTSPRTPAAIEQRVARLLTAADAPTLLAAPGQPPAYSSLLAAADSIRVTADSVSMISDAIWTGKPLAVVPVANSTVGRIYMGVADRLRPGLPVYPQDLRFFWRGLSRLGLGDQLSPTPGSIDAQMRRVSDRARSLLSN